MMTCRRCVHARAGEVASKTAQDMNHVEWVNKQGACL